MLQPLAAPQQQPQQYLVAAPLGVQPVGLAPQQQLGFAQPLYPQASLPPQQQHGFAGGMAGAAVQYAGPAGAAQFPGGQQLLAFQQQQQQYAQPAGGGSYAGGPGGGYGMVPAAQQPQAQLFALPGR